MKKLLVLTAVFALVFGSVGLVGAATFTEEYTGSQFVNEGSSYNFGFDLWYAGGGGTNSSLALTKDAIGAFGTYGSGKVYASLYDTDGSILLGWDPEKANVQLIAYGITSGVQTQLFSDTINFNVTGLFPNYNFLYNLNASQLDLLDNYGWGKIVITASSLSGATNDFAIKKVGVEVGSNGSTAVPEPTTLILLGSGLLGLVGLRRVC